MRSRYVKGKRIGRGSFGNVFRGYAIAAMISRPGSSRVRCMTDPISASL
jgi:hypothetical protein